MKNKKCEPQKRYVAMEQAMNPEEWEAVSIGLTAVYFLNTMAKDYADGVSEMLSRKGILSFESKRETMILERRYKEWIWAIEKRVMKGEGCVAAFDEFRSAFDKSVSLNGNMLNAYKNELRRICGFFFSKAEFPDSTGNAEPESTEENVVKESLETLMNGQGFDVSGLNTEMKTAMAEYYCNLIRPTVEGFVRKTAEHFGIPSLKKTEADGK